MAGSLGTISGQVRLDVAQALAQFAALRTATAASRGALTQAGTALTTFGKTALVAGGLFSAAIGLAVSKAAEFEKKMDFFGAVSNSTAEQMAKVRDMALELGRTSQFSASQIADAFVEMGKAGITAEQITGGMAQAIVNLASAADINLADATNIVTSQIQTYNLAAADAVHVTDELAGAANASIVDVSDLGTSLKYVGGVAHALGISFDSTVDALSLLGKAGIKGSTAGTSLRQIMVSLAGGTSKAKDELKALGIITEDGTNKFFNADGSAKSLAEVFQILQDHTRGLSQEQQLMAFRTIFNNRALAAAEILTKAGAAGFAEMNAEISKTTAADVAAKRMDNLAGDIQKLKGNIDTLLIQAGTPLQEFLRQVVQHVTRLVQAFGELSPQTQMIIFKAISITGILLTLVGVLGIFSGSVLKIMSATRIFAGALQVVLGLMRALTIATAESTAAALTNPYVLLAVAIVALIAGLVILYKRSKAFQDFMNAIGRGIKTGFLATVEFFKSMPAFFAGVWKYIVDAFDNGVAWIQRMWNSITSTISDAAASTINFFASIGKAVVDFFRAIPGAVSNAVSTGFNALVAFLARLPYYVGFAIGWILGRITRFALDIAKWFWEMGLSAYNAVKWAFTELPGIIATKTAEIWASFTKWVADMAQAIWDWATNAYNTTVDWFSKLPGRIVDFFVDLYNRSVQFFKDFTNASITWAVETYNNVVDWFARLPGRIVDFLIDLWHRAEDIGSNIANWSVNLGRNIWNGLVDTLQNLPSKVYDILGNVLDAFKDMVRGAYNQAKDFASGLWEGFKSGLGIHSPSYIERAMWAITDVTDEESKRLASQVRTMQTLAGTMDENNPAAAAQASNMAKLGYLIQNMRDQASMLANAANVIFPTPALAMAGAGSSSKSIDSAAQTVSESADSGRAIVTNIFNPVAERASDSAARRLRTLNSMGAFG